jgi:hypothetical protein
MISNGELFAEVPSVITVEIGAVARRARVDPAWLPDVLRAVKARAAVLPGICSAGTPAVAHRSRRFKSG